LLLIQIWEEKQYAFRAMVRAVLLDQSIIDDVLQEAFTRVLQSRRKFSDRKEAFHYLRKTVLATTIDMYRRSRRQTSRITDCRSLTEFSADVVRENPDPLGLLLMQEQAEERRLIIDQVRSALESLPPVQKQAIELFFNRSRRSRLKDICKESGIPYSTLRSRVIRGVDRIRLRLREEGVPGFHEHKEVKTK
jgi:RNA polymerase sigma factor (sigma-70 family)